MYYLTLFWKMATGGPWGLIHLLASSSHRYQTVINSVARGEESFIAIKRFRFCGIEIASTARSDPWIDIAHRLADDNLDGASACEAEAKKQSQVRSFARNSDADRLDPLRAPCTPEDALRR